MAVQSFTDLQNLFAPKNRINVLPANPTPPYPTGPINLGGGQSPGDGSGGGSGGGTAPPVGSIGSTSAGVNCANPFNYMVYPSCWTGQAGQAIGAQLLRLALFLIGLICIIGAIYLYKGNNPVLTVPAGMVKGATKAVAGAAKNALQAGEEA